jgi:vacuolar-type H+-ATPase subunit H
MARETIEAVIKAEEKAALIEKDAVTEGETIVLKAKEDAKELVAAMTRERLSQSEKDLISAQEKCEALMKAAIEKAEQDIIMLKEVIKDKEQVAITNVLSNFL